MVTSCTVVRRTIPAVGFVVLGLLAGDPLVARGHTPEPLTSTTIQFQVDTGGGPFVLSLLEGAPAFVRWADTTTSMVAFFPRISDEARGTVDLAVFEVEHHEEGLRLGKSLGKISARPGSPSYLPGPHFVELRPLSIQRGDSGPVGLLRKEGPRKELPDGPFAAGLCCITSGGVTTCGCAVQGGDQSCCAPACCHLIY